MAALYDDNFKLISRAALIGSGAQGYFKVQGYPGYPVIITSFNYSASEKIQVIEAFKEYIHLYAYGRAASSVQIQGMCLNIGDDFKGSAQALKTVYQEQLRAFKVAQKGGLISIVGPVGVLKGVAINMTFSIMSGQDGMFNFSMGFVVLDGTNESSVGQAQGEGGASSQTNSTASSGTSSGPAASAGENVNYGYSSAQPAAEYPARQNNESNMNSMLNAPSSGTAGEVAVTSKGKATPFKNVLVGMR